MRTGDDYRCRGIVKLRSVELVPRDACLICAQGKYAGNLRIGEKFRNFAPGIPNLWQDVQPAYIAKMLTLNHLEQWI